MKRIVSVLIMSFLILSLVGNSISRASPTSTNTTTSTKPKPKKNPTVLWGLEDGISGPSTAVLGMTPDILSWFPQGSTAPLQQMRKARAEGSIPMLSWEPKDTLTNIAAGKDDAQILTWAQGAKAYGHPFYFRPFSEFNNQGLHTYSAGKPGNSPGKMYAAWRHVWTIFRHAGAWDALFTWTVGYSGDLTHLKQSWPGRSYVNYVGIDPYDWDPASCSTVECHYIRALKAILKFSGSTGVILAEWGIGPGPTKGQVFDRSMVQFGGKDRIHAVVYFDEVGNPAWKQPDWSLANPPSALVGERKGVREPDVINLGITKDECYAYHNTWKHC